MTSRTLDDDKRDRLIAAVCHERLEDVRQIIANDVTDINLKTEGGWTPLMFAVSHGHSEIVHALVEAGADVWLLNRQNEDVFHIAKKKGFLDILEILEQGR
jgi:ankyrin repeat protein